MVDQIHCWWCLAPAKDRRKLFTSYEVPFGEHTTRIIKHEAGQVGVSMDDGDICSLTAGLQPHPEAYICDQCIKDLAASLKVRL